MPLRRLRVFNYSYQHKFWLLWCQIELVRDSNASFIHTGSEKMHQHVYQELVKITFHAPCVRRKPGSSSCGNTKFGHLPYIGGPAYRTDGVEFNIVFIQYFFYEGTIQLCFGPLFSNPVDWRVIILMDVKFVKFPFLSFAQIFAGR